MILLKGDKIKQVKNLSKNYFISVLEYFEAILRQFTGTICPETITCLLIFRT